MNLVKDAFTVLYFLATTDGLDERENRVIVDFIRRQHNDPNFKPGQTLLDLELLDAAGRAAEYERALQGFKAASSISDRLTLLDFAVDLAAADGVIADGEKVLFRDMAAVWEIDLQKFFDQRAALAAVPVAATTPTNNVNPAEKLILAVDFTVTLMVLLASGNYTETTEANDRYFFSVPASWRDADYQTLAWQTAAKMYRDLYDHFRRVEPNDPNYIGLKRTAARVLTAAEIAAKPWRQTVPAIWETSPCVVVDANGDYRKVGAAEFEI